jgi:hypothetical protein
VTVFAILSILTGLATASSATATATTVAARSTGTSTASASALTGPPRLAGLSVSRGFAHGTSSFDAQHATHGFGSGVIQ